VKSVPAALQAHLDAGATTLCTCWRVQRLDGQVFGFTDHDRPLSFDGVTYQPDSGFSASEAASTLGLAVDSMEVQGALSSAAITEADIALGKWDNAVVEIFRVNWSDTSQRVLLRKGTLGEIGRGDIAFVAEIRGLSHELGQQKGRTYSRVCDAVLGDGRCKVDLSNPAFRATGIVTAATDGNSIRATGIAAHASGWFARGVLTWTGGANAGTSAEVSSHSGDGLMLWERASQPIVAGDTFIVTAGCKKTFAECQAKFSNTLNFRGFPHIPGNDFALSTAKRSGINDGGSFFV
jgi:uncharacterized phage protein (TIGR02218 family)